jgi:hypothetical protein
MTRHLVVALAAVVILLATIADPILTIAIFVVGLVWVGILRRRKARP